MSDGEKKRLIDLLAETHAATRATVEGVDPELRVHTDTEAGWRIRDVIGHLAVWDRKTARSLRALRGGTEYSIPDFDEDVYNQQAAQQQRKLTDQHAFAEWEHSHEDHREAVEQIPLDQFPGDLLYPWGDERGNIAQLFEYMAEHEVEHREEMAKAIQAAQED